MYFAKLETEFRDIILSWKINEIACLDKRIFSIYTLLIVLPFFQQKLNQNTNMCNDDGNESRVARNGCSDRYEPFGYDITDFSM